MKYNYTLVYEGFMGAAPMISLNVHDTNTGEIWSLGVDIFRKPEDECFTDTAQRMVEEIEGKEGMLERMQNYQESLIP